MFVLFWGGEGKLLLGAEHLTICTRDGVAMFWLGWCITVVTEAVAVATAVAAVGELLGLVCGYAPTGGNESIGLGPDGVPGVDEGVNTPRGLVRESGDIISRFARRFSLIEITGFFAVPGEEHIEPPSIFTTTSEGCLFTPPINPEVVKALPSLDLESSSSFSKELGVLVTLLPPLLALLLLLKVVLLLLLFLGK